MKRLISSIAASLVCIVLSAHNQADSLSYRNHLSVNLRSGYLAPTHPFFRGENEFGERLNLSSSVHLQYAFSFPSGTYFGKTFPTAYQGIGVGFNNFYDNKEIGRPTAVYLLQGARLAKLSPCIDLSYEWNFGISFGWHPYKEYENSYNMVVGSRANAYINFGLLLDWRITPSWNMKFGLEATHFSNGNTKYPNAGVNTLGGRICATYSFDTRIGEKVTTALTRTGIDDESGHRNRWTLDAILYGAGRAKGMIWKDNVYIVSGKFGILGVNLNPMFRINKFLKTGISADIQYDESANLDKHVAGNYVDSHGEDLRFYRPPLRESIGAGLSLRAEFVMPIFSVNVGIGHNVIYKGDDLKGWYQIVALKTNVSRHLFLHVGYKMCKFHDPNNLMLGIGWRFGDNRW